MKELSGYYAQHNIYKYKGGVWVDDFGIGPEFRKEDVKKIYADHEQECTIILLKDGTEIKPDFDIYGGIYEERTEAWKQKILDYKGDIKPKPKPWKKYKVYERTRFGPVFASKTMAKSKAHAVNNVRHNTYGEQGYNDDFFAVEVPDENMDYSQHRWFVIEYCVRNGYDPYFDSRVAHYTVVYEQTEDDAKETVRNQFYFYGDGSDGAYRDAFFGRVKKFDSKDAAYECASKWKIQNKKEIESTAESRQKFTNLVNEISQNLGGDKNGNE